MKVYVMTTGAVFGLITLAHILRIIVEGLHLATEPSYVLLTSPQEDYPFGLGSCLDVRNSRDP